MIDIKKLIMCLHLTHVGLLNTVRMHYQKDSDIHTYTGCPICFGPAEYLRKYVLLSKMFQTKVVGLKRSIY